MYHYAANNPVKYTDPDGREHEELSSKIVGIIAHKEIEEFLIYRYGGSAEQKVTNGGKDGKDGRYDYKNGDEIYEIKPITQQNMIDGKIQLARYVNNTRNARKGRTLLPKINGEIIKDIQLINDFYMDLRLITFSSPDQEGMIYYEAMVYQKPTEPFQLKIPEFSLDPKLTTMPIAVILLLFIAALGAAAI